VVGLFRSRIVLPAWALSADEEARRLVLEHEQEHVRAGDPRLLAAALVFAALIPWNPAAWWQLRRLRLAIEVDCDARVLRRRADVRAYGTVLLEVGRRAVRSRLPLAAFAEPVSSLERRIRIMTAPRASRPLLRAAGCGALAAALTAAACETPQPTQPSRAAGDRSSTLLSYELAWDDTTVLGTGLGPARTALTPAAAVARYFPDVATKGTAPDDILQFVVSSDGEVLRHEWVRGTPDPRVPGRGLGDPRLQSTLREFRGMIAGGRLVRFRAGEVGPTATQVAWTQLRPPPGFADPRGPGSEHVRALNAAIRRHYPPQLRDAGITARVAVSFTVGQDGKARGVEVARTVAPPFAQAARAVVADLITFPPGEPGQETVMLIDFSPERPPAPAAR
jgi:TonB family protein